MFVSPTGGKLFQRIDSINSETNINIIQVLINKTGMGLMGIYKPEKYLQSHLSCCPALESPIPTYWETLTRVNPSSSTSPTQCLLFFVPCILALLLHPHVRFFKKYLLENLSKKWQDFQSTWWADRRDLVASQVRGIPGPRVLWWKVQGEREQKENRCAQWWARDDFSIFKIIGNRYGPLGLSKEINNIFLVVYEMWNCPFLSCSTSTHGKM